MESSGIVLPDEAEIRSLEQSERYKYIGIHQSDDIKNKEIKQMTKKEYFRRLRKVLKASLNGKNTIESINSSAVATVRWSAIPRRNCKLDLGRHTRNGQENTKAANCISVHAPTGRCRQTELEETRRRSGLN